MSNETIVALFGTRADADSARSELERSGVPASAIDIRAGSGTSLDDTEQAPEHKGFWDWLFGENGPDERHTYSERLSSGNVLLSVHPDTLDNATILEVLHRYDPLDIDEQTSGLGRTADAPMGSVAPTAALGPNSAVLGEAADNGQLSSSRTDVSGAGISGGVAGTTGDGSILEPRTGSLEMAGETDRLSSGRMDASDDALIDEDLGRTTGDEGIIPLVQEELVVGKRMVDHGTVRVRSYVVEQPVERQVDLRQETITVERRQPVTGTDAPAGAIAERVIEVTQRAEEPVVEKRARVTEEVVVRREDSSRTETVHDTVRGTEVEVERDGVLENRKI
jgi:uncharacterized protein (TIGR02271 family)